MKVKTTQTILLTFVILYSFCNFNVLAQDNKSEYIKHEAVTDELITMIKHNSEIKRMLVNSIKRAKRVNPDKTTNPAQTLEEYYNFIDLAAKAMPWSLLPNVKYSTLHGQIS